MEERVKGTVTSLSTVFPAEEAQKASKHVHDTIAERQKELHQLQDFIADNSSLVNLVQKLPDQLHHDIMVPFGKAAFFPGRLIHTNEFLVLLGEGYYVDRTSKQTIEILKRRGKALESHVESFEAVMQDLKAEASFFDATATEAAEGLVEIREDYMEEASGGKVSTTGVPKPDSRSFSEADNMKATAEDEEYAHILSRIDELEKEEFEAENVSKCNENEQNEDDFDHHISQSSLVHGVKSPDISFTAHMLSKSLEQSKDGYSTSEASLKNQFQHDFSDQLNFEGPKVHPISKDGSSHLQRPAFGKSNNTEKALKLPELKENIQVAPTSKSEVSVHTPEAGSDRSKAFTGSIIEHAHNKEMNPREQTAAHNSKPVSRFKLQRR